MCGIYTTITMICHLAAWATIREIVVLSVRVWILNTPLIFNLCVILCECDT